MPTLLDELVVRIGLDAAQFRQGAAEVETQTKRTKEETVRATTEIEQAGKRAAQWYSTLKSEVMGLLGLLLGAAGLREFINQTTRAEISTGNLSRVIGMSVQEVNAWGEAVKRLGFDSQPFLQSLAGMRTNIERLIATGQSNEGTQWLTRVLGPESLTRISRFGLQTEDLLKIAEQLGQLAKINPARAGVIAQLIGLDQGGFQLLSRGREQVEGILQIVRQHGLMTPADVKAGQDFQAALSGAEQSATSIFRTLLTGFEPGMSKILEGFAAWLDKLRESKQAMSELDDIVTGMVSGTAFQVMLRVFGIGGPAGWAAGLAVFAAAANQSAMSRAMEGKPFKAAEGLDPQQQIEEIWKRTHPGEPPPKSLPEAIGHGVGWLWRRVTGAFAPREHPVGSPGGGWDSPAPTLPGAGIPASGAPKGTRGDPVFVAPAVETPGYYGWPGGGSAPGTLEGAGSSPGQPFFGFGRNVTGPFRAVTSAQQQANATWLAQQAMNKYGLTPAQAYGIVGNAMQESGLNPTITNPSSGAYGLFQHAFSRKADLLRWAEQNHMDPSTRETQWAFTQWELENTPLGRETLARLRMARTPEEAAQAWSLFEFGSDENRRKYAGQYGWRDWYAREMFQKSPYAAQRANPPHAAAVGHAPLDPALGAAALLPVGSAATHVDNSVDSDVSIGVLNVNASQAKDAEGIAQGIGPQLRKYVFVSRFNYGLA